MFTKKITCLIKILTEFGIWNWWNSVNLPRKSLNSRPTLSRYWISRVDWDWFLQSTRIHWDWICQWKTWRNKKSLWNCYFGYKLWQCGHKLFLKQYVSKIIPHDPDKFFHFFISVFIILSNQYQKLLCSKSHDFLSVFALAHSKINQTA